VAFTGFNIPLAAPQLAWDVDRYNLPHGEELAGGLIYVPGEEQPFDGGTV
jgi:hypothetical protein